MDQEQLEEFRQALLSLRDEIACAQRGLATLHYCQSTFVLPGTGTG